MYDKMYQVQIPGTILRARHTPHNGKLALVLTRAYQEQKGTTSGLYPPNQYVDMQWLTSGERFQEFLTNANNCFDIVSSCGTLDPTEN